MEASAPRTGVNFNRGPPAHDRPVIGVLDYNSDLRAKTYAPSIRLINPERDKPSGYYVFFNMPVFSFINDY